MKLFYEYKKDLQKEIHFFLLFLHIHRIIYTHELHLIRLQKIHKMKNKEKQKLLREKKLLLQKAYITKVDDCLLMQNKSTFLVYFLILLKVKSI